MSFSNVIYDNFISPIISLIYIYVINNYAVGSS